MLPRRCPFDLKHLGEFCFCLHVVMPDFAVAAAVTVGCLGIAGTIWSIAHGGEAAFSGTARIYRWEDELVKDLRELKHEVRELRKSSSKH